MQPDIIALITLYPTNRGGRQGATPPDKFGCLFELNGEYFDCRLLLGGIGALSPGQTAVVPILFLSPELLRGHISVSQAFYLRDGCRIADGEVVQTFLT